MDLVVFWLLMRLWLARAFIGICTRLELHWMLLDALNPAIFSFQVFESTIPLLFILSGCWRWGDYTRPWFINQSQWFSIIQFIFAFKLKKKDNPLFCIIILLYYSVCLAPPLCKPRDEEWGAAGWGETPELPTQLLLLVMEQEVLKRGQNPLSNTLAYKWIPCASNPGRMVSHMFFVSYWKDLC